MGRFKYLITNTMKKRLLLLLIVPMISFGQTKMTDWPPEIQSDQTFVYKEIDEAILNLWV